jgi:hypothetical protein
MSTTATAVFLWPDIRHSLKRAIAVAEQNRDRTTKHEVGMASLLKSPAATQRAHRHLD